MQGLLLLCATAIWHSTALAAWVYGAPDRVVPAPLRIGAILRTHESQQMINSWLLFVSTVNAHGGLRLQSEQTLLQLVVIEADADAAGNAGNVSFWLTVGEVPSASPEGLIVTTGNTRGLTNAVSLFDNVEAQILNMLIRTVHQKVSTLTVLVESGYQGCDNVRTIAAQWNLLVVVQALESLQLEALLADTALLLCASATASQRFVRSAKLADYMPQAILVTCPVLELQSTLGEDADFLIAFQRELPLGSSELGAAARNHIEFVEDYQRRFLQLPSDAAVLAYSSAQHLAQAIAAAASEPDAVAALLRQRGQAVTGQVVQLQAGAAAQVGLRFPAASWAERSCWLQGLEGFGFRDGNCGRCNATEEARVNWTSGRRECVPCPRSGESTCRCEAGTSNETGSCQPCAPGRFAFGAATSSCTLCPPGFISKAGASSCEACGLGYYAPEAGLSECLPCQLGHSANTTGRSTCSSCPAGTFGFMGLCQECPVGSFQAVPGQSACREDGLGQRSLSNGTVLPGNVPGFYAIWAVSEDEAFRRASFEMEPCVKEEACLAERCGQGSTGRQCFGVLGGFSAGASARYKCVSWQLYMAIGIAMAVLYLAAYTRFATVLATSEEASHQLYLMMLKMLMNHCASMSVLLSCFLRATMHGPLLESFLSLVMITDGVPPCGNEVFSLHCLLQPWRTQELRQAFDALANTSQVDYSSPTLAEARATLATFHRTTELRSLIFWASLPLVAALLPCLLLLMWLRIYMARHAQHWLKAAEFSSKVHFDGLDVTCGSYPPEALQQIMAISSRRLWGLSWPLMHCNAWVHSTPPTRSMLGSFCCCLLSPILFIPRLFSKLDLLRFWTETVPLRTCLLYFFWFPAARRCFSTLHCQRLGAAAVPMPGTVMYSNGVLECDLSQPLLLLSLLAGSLWTMWPFFCWFQLYQRRSMDASFRRPYGIMLLGYNTSCWWWEVVVCLQKFLFIVIEAVPFSAVQECFLIVCVSLAAMLCHVTWRPFDHRWFDLLIRLEIKHLLVLLCSAFLCMISLQNWLLPETTVILMASLQGIYVLTLLLSFGHLKLLSTETSSLKHWKKGCLKRFLKFLLAYKRWYNDSEPYIAYDNVHRYVSVLANVGGQCTLPHLPIGRQLEAAGQESHAQVRCKLSDVPRHLQKCSFVSSVEQREVTRELLFTVAALAKDSATMSSFLLDFVVRAAFLMAADLRERHSEADELPQEVDKHAWQEANRKRDLLVIASMAEEQRQRDLLYGKATRGGPSIQKDLELEEEAISGWGLQLLQDAVAETDQSVAMTDAGHGRRPEIGEAVAVVHQKVYRMFSPTIFRRGCTLQELKASMLLLRNTPRDELQQWLDFFEKVWFLEFLDSDKEIHLMSGTRLEQGVHADAMEILKAFRRPRRVTQNALGEPVQDGMDENNIKVYLKWVRFVLYHYCGGIQAVDLGDVMRTRLSRPSRFVIQNQMEKVHEEVVVSVDEDALQRVEKGLEAALAEGLGLEPAQTALERLERGVDRALSLDESADEISL